MVLLLSSLMASISSGSSSDVGVLVDLVALDDVGVLDLADALHDLLIVDAAAGRLVDLAEGDLGLAFDGVVDLDAIETRRKRRKPFQ